MYYNYAQNRPHRYVFVCCEASEDGCEFNHLVQAAAVAAHKASAWEAVCETAEAGRVQV